MSKIDRPPLSISKIAKFMQGEGGKIAVVVGTVSDDVRLFDVPKLRVCGLRFQDQPRATPKPNQKGNPDRRRSNWSVSGG